MVHGVDDIDIRAGLGERSHDEAHVVPAVEGSARQQESDAQRLHDSASLRMRVRTGFASKWATAISRAARHCRSESLLIAAKAAAASSIVENRDMPSPVGG